MTKGKIIIIEITFDDSWDYWLECDARKVIGELLEIKKSNIKFKILQIINPNPRDINKDQIK